MSAVEYGILCNPGNEAVIVKNVNTFLASRGYRKMYKRIPSGRRSSDSTREEPRYSHYYCQFLREHPRWYFDLYPNVDLDGKARFARSDVGWTLFVNEVSTEHNSAQDNENLGALLFAPGGEPGLSGRHSAHV